MHTPIASVGIKYLSAKITITSLIVHREGHEILICQVSAPLWNALECCSVGASSAASPSATGRLQSYLRTQTLLFAYLWVSNLQWRAIWGQFGLCSSSFISDVSGCVSFHCESKRRICNPFMGVRCLCGCGTNWVDNSLTLIEFIIRKQNQSGFFS
jgi:hypothetical protein